MAQSKITMITNGWRQLKMEYQIRPVLLSMKKFGMIEMNQKIK